MNDTARDSQIDAELDNTIDVEVQFTLIAYVNGDEVYEITRPSTQEIEGMFSRADGAVQRSITRLIEDNNG